MNTLARFAIRNRWWVIAGWVAFIILTQLVASALGGANYKDSFTLPGTETQTVSTLLKNAGQNNQNGIDGLMVVHAKTGSVATTPPAGVIDALQRECTAGHTVVTMDTGWGAINCGQGHSNTLDPAQPVPSRS
jgi:RND superfamily putative drug exporter